MAHEEDTPKQQSGQEKPVVRRDKVVVTKVTSQELSDTETPHTLEAIKITQQYYGNLPEMKFRDWANLIKTVKFENESNGSSICSNL